MQAVERFGVERRSMHLDATSFAVEGDYAGHKDGWSGSDSDYPRVLA